jgi:hypothetical protein
MATGSKGGRTYSDPSYGSIKTITLVAGSAGTRATELVSRFVAMNPITIVDWTMSNTVLGTGGSSQWVLAATSSSGTSALGTIIFVGTHGPGAQVNGSVATETTIPTGGALDIYSVLSTAAPTLNVYAVVSYRETFDVSDN